MRADASQPVSELLVRWKQGEEEALQALLPLVYHELRRLAHHHLQAERAGHTLQSTGLVHEAYLRLVGQEPLRLDNRAHFFAVASHLMRQILVDYARKHCAAKRGAGVTRLSLDPNIASPGPGQERAVDLLTLDEALDRLAKLDSQQSQIIELRYFGGLAIEDTSKFLEVSAATVKRSWASARAWLQREMSRRESPA